MKDMVLDSLINTHPTSRSPSPEPLTHHQEQAALRKETISAFHTAVSDDEEDDILVPREKTKDELQREEEEYAEFLRREVGEDLGQLVDVEPSAVLEGVQEPEKESKKRKSKEGKSNKSKEEQDHEFLMKYALSPSLIPI
jgi:protein KRI1